MQAVSRVVMVDPCTQTREELKRMLAGLDPIWVEAECPKYDQLPDVLSQTSPDIVVINLDGDPVQGLQMVDETLRASPQSRVFVTSSQSDSQRILQAMRSGAHEYLTTPVPMDDLLMALERARQANSVRGNGSAQSTVVAVTGVVGGVGSTSIAVNLASAWAADPARRVVLVDLDLVMGDADVCLNLVHNYTLMDVVENINRLDFTLLKRSVVRHESGVSFLPHPTHLTDVARVRPDSLKRLVGLLKATFTHVVLDLSNGFRETDIAAMETAETILLVAQHDVSCVRNVSRLFKALEGMQGLSDRIKLILNRVGAKELSIPVEKAEETMGRKVFWQVPNDWHNMVTSRNVGVPLVQHAPRSKVAASIRELAEALTGTSAAAPHIRGPAKRRGLLSLLG